MTANPAAPIVEAALALRQSHPHAPAADVLALAMQGHDGRDLAWGDAAVPPHAFAMLVADAFADSMTPVEWLGLLPQVEDPAQLLEHFARTTWVAFLHAYGMAPALPVTPARALRMP